MCRPFGLKASDAVRGMRMSEISLSASVMTGLGLQVETLDKLPITGLDEQIILTLLCDINCFSYKM